MDKKMKNKKLLIVEPMWAWKAEVIYLELVKQKISRDECSRNYIDYIGNAHLRDGRRRLS